MVPRAKPGGIIPVERIAAQIYLVRGQSVRLDSELAALYGVTTGRLNEQVKRNTKRFPSDFAFQLTSAEFDTLLSQIAIAKHGRGGRRNLPWVFTEHGVAMLSSILRSNRAADVNVAMMRTFVRLRRMLTMNDELARKVSQHDQQIGILFKHIRTLLEPPKPPKKPSIGFRVKDSKA